MDSVAEPGVLGVWDFCAVAVYFGLILGVGISVKFWLEILKSEIKSKIKVKKNIV